jgi:hypothetical protein
MADWISLLGAVNGATLTAFGREVVYSPQLGLSTTLKAIFEKTHEAEENAPGVYAALFLQASDLASPPQRGDEVTVDGVVYTVFDIEADQGGGLVLRLRRV